VVLQNEGTERASLTLKPQEMRNSTEAVKLLQDFGKWIVTIDTAAIGALGYFVFVSSDKLSVAGKTPAGPIANLPTWEQFLLGTTLLSFGLSLVFASWLLLALPGVMQRASEDSEHDIFWIGTLDGHGIKVVMFVALEHSLFVLGITLFAAFAASFWNIYWSWTFAGLAGLWFLRSSIDFIRSWKHLIVESQSSDLEGKDRGSFSP
jgi:hypothetical protein